MSKKQKKMTYEEWEQERLLQLQREAEVERKKRRAAAGRFLKLLKKRKPIQALDKDDKTLIHEYWDEKYG